MHYRILLVSLRPQPNFHTVVILSVAAKLPLAAAPWPCCAAFAAFEVSLVELRLRFLLDIDFFLLSRVMLDGAMTSPRSSNRLSTDPPRFLKQTKWFKNQFGKLDNNKQD